MRKKCVILGGGGHAKVLIDILQFQSQDVSIRGILDRNTEFWGSNIYGVPILGGDDLLPGLISEGVNCFVVGLGGVGNNNPRQRLFEFGLACHLQPYTVIHPNALISRFATITPGAQLFPGAIINAGARIGQNVIVNTGSIVEHDCEIMEHVHIASGAKLAGAVKVGVGVHIGAGATILQCVTIGEYTVIGAGAVVLKDVPPRSVFVGVPARPLEK